MVQTREKQTDTEFSDKVIAISRVAKVVKGGRRFSFSALVLVGDGKSRVGFGVGKAGEAPNAVQKAAAQAKKNLFSIKQFNGTIPFEVIGKFGSSTVVMFPAKPGKGIIAGGAVRSIVELGGLKDIVCKIHGSKNGHNVVRATFNGLMKLMSREIYAIGRDKNPEHIVQARAHIKKTAETVTEGNK